uniref:Uncharacterized protein n=1 Tax=Eptatretus burgeri TaxID=7764 RepID=A0A8C4RCZ6_EPTBU
MDHNRVVMKCFSYLQDNVLTEHKLELLTAKFQKELEDQQKQTFTNLEKHKMNYAILKERYIRLKKIMNDVNADMRQVILERDTVQSENVKIVEELAAKTREAKDLQDNVLTEHKLELLTAKIQKELEDQHKQTFTNLEKKVVHYQRECDKLKNHIWFLQTDLDLQQKNNGYLLDKIQSQHNAELTQRRVKYKKLHTHRSESAQKRKCNRPCTDALERVNVLVERVTSCEAQLANERTKAESEQQILMQKLRDTQATLSTAELSCKLFAGALLNR